MKNAIFIFLLILVSCKTQVDKNDNDYQNMKQIIDHYIKNTVYYKVLKENGLQTKFYITDLSSDKKETVKSDSLKQMLLKDGVYAFYVNDIRYSFTHIYVKYKGNVKVFESINCPSDSLKISQAQNYVLNNFGNNTANNISNYSKYIEYFKIDPQSKLNCKR